MNSCFIIGGDLNAEHTHWGSRLITTKGCELYKAVADTGYEIVSTGKTNILAQRSKKELPYLLDFSVVKNISTNYIKIKDGFDLNSDHSPMYQTISDKIITKDRNPVLTN
jgi:hypothetical protein